MSEKHLKEGDSLPPFGGKLRLFSMRFCPYAHRSTLVLNAKKLDYETVFINLDSKPEWYTEINPLGSVPALELEPGVVVTDSNIINVYLDEQHPEVPLQAPEPLRRAQDKILVEQLAPFMRNYYTAAFSPDNITEETKTGFFKGLDLLQKEILKRGKKFINGNEPGLVDFAIWPWLERIEALPLLGQTDFAIEKEKYGTLLTYIENMKQVPAVKAYILGPETHAKFTESRRKGAAEYNMLDTSGDACCFRPKKKK